ncbi:MAG: hypothetical protein U0R19_13120 [Bryobacteraceae bacterium]
MRETIALFLVLTLVYPQGATATQISPKEQAVTISRGNAVEVRFLDGSKLRGWIGEVSDTGFVLTTEKAGVQQIRFDQLKSLRDMKKTTFGRSLGRGYLIAIIVVVAIAVTFGIVCHENLCSG